MMYPTRAFKLCPLMVTGMMALCLVISLKVISLLECYAASSQFLAYVKNEASLCIYSCLSSSQLYDKEYLFSRSMPNKIFVFGSLSHMTKVWENLKLVIQRCRVALPNENTADPSAVFRYTAAGSISVL